MYTDGTRESSTPGHVMHSPRHAGVINVSEIIDPPLKENDDKRVDARDGGWCLLGYIEPHQRHQGAGSVCLEVISLQYQFQNHSSIHPLFDCRVIRGYYWQCNAVYVSRVCG